MDCETVRVQLDKIELRRPREWGACWLGLYVWDLPEQDVSLLLAQLGLSLPEQPPPKVYASGKTSL